MAVLRIILQVIFFGDCIALMGIVLLQMSEHSGMGGAFGSGMSSTVFGRDETRDPKRTLTVILASIFMAIGFLLSIL
jgi:preprotein translocase subunit SecG